MFVALRLNNQVTNHPQLNKVSRWANLRFDEVTDQLGTNEFLRDRTESAKRGDIVKRGVSMNEFILTEPKHSELISTARS